MCNKSIFKLVSCYIYIIPLFSCHINGQVGASSDIAESVKRKVFISEYIPTKNVFMINDTLQIQVLRAWVEKHWAYSENGTGTITFDGYQMIVETSDTNLKNYQIKWMIGVDGNRYFRSCSKNCLMADFDSIPAIVEKWQIQQGNRLGSLVPKKIIGEFELRKKM